VIARRKLRFNALTRACCTEQAQTAGVVSQSDTGQMRRASTTKPKRRRKAKG
jgi:hypothetical protein